MVLHFVVECGNTTDMMHYEAKITGGNGLNIMPMRTSFELSSLVYLESVIAKIILMEQIYEEDLKANHTNLE